MNMAYYTNANDDTKYGHLKDAKASARARLTRIKGSNVRIIIHKWKITTAHSGPFGGKYYYDEICGIASKVTDPDGLVVYLYNDVVESNDNPYSVRFMKGPVRILEKDGSSPKIVSVNEWTECKNL